VNQTTGIEGTTSVDDVRACVNDLTISFAIAVLGKVCW